MPSPWPSCYTDYVMLATIFVKTNIKLLQNPGSIFRGMLADWLAGRVSVISHLFSCYCHCSNNVLFLLLLLTLLNKRKHNIASKATIHLNNTITDFVSVFPEDGLRFMMNFTVNNQYC